VKNGIAKASGKLVIVLSKCDVWYRSIKFFGDLKDETVSADTGLKMEIVAKKEVV
jgi:hypothetical protein